MKTIVYHEGYASGPTKRIHADTSSDPNWFFIDQLGGPLWYFDADNVELLRDACNEYLERQTRDVTRKITLSRKDWQQLAKINPRIKEQL